MADGLANARDLGGLRRRDGTLTPPGVFFRSESVDRLTPEGWSQLRAVGIRTIVDLRQEQERAADVGDRPGWVETVHVDLDGLENSKFWAEYWENGLVGTAMYYLPHLEAMPERSRSALRAIVGARPGGVLFHCAAGRDRTGLIAMLLLVAADVEPDDIVDDYLETVRLGDVRAAAWNRTNDEGEIEKFCRRHGTTTEGAFRSALDGLALEAVLGWVPEPGWEALSTWRGTLGGSSGGGIRRTCRAHPDGPLDTSRRCSRTVDDASRWLVGGAIRAPAGALRRAPHRLGLPEL